MNIRESFEVPVGIDEAWTLFKEPETLVAHIPGASLESRLEDGSYRGLIAVPFGPRTIRLAGGLTYVRDDEARRGTLVGTAADGRGASRASFRSEFGLVSLDPDRTRVDVAADVRFGGALVQIGETGGPHVVRLLLRAFSRSLSKDLRRDGGN